MASTTTTRIRAARPGTILGALLLAAFTAIGPGAAPAAARPAPTASDQAPPPVSCITDNPVDPLGPGYLLERDRFTTIDHPNARVETQPFGNNNRGQIVGGYDTPGFVFRGFLLDRGRYTTIDFPGASRSFAARINARGQIVGNYEDARGGCHGFLLHKSRYTTIDVPGKPTQALGLNDRGQVVGGTVDPDDGRISGFLLDEGVVTSIDFPGSLSTNALDINNRGQIAGVYADAQRTGHGYVRDRSGAFTTIDVPGASLTSPSASTTAATWLVCTGMPTRSATASCTGTGRSPRSTTRSRPPTAGPRTSTTGARSLASTSATGRTGCRPAQRRVRASRPCGRCGDRRGSDDVVAPAVQGAAGRGQSQRDMARCA
jgi:hypothetical protein